MMNYFKSIYTLFLAGALMLFWACSGPAQKEEQNTVAGEEEFESAQKSRSDLLAQIDKVIHELPPPSSVPFLLKSTGADFDSQLANSLDKLEVYQIDNEKAALNLGVYATDVGYYASYEQVQDAMKYMEACQQLADMIGASSAFDARLIQRFEENLSNRDSLAILVNEAMDMAEKQMEDKDRITAAVLALTGSFIEGLYISTSLIENYPKELTTENRSLVLEPVIRVVIDQKLALLDLIGLLKSIEQDEAVTSLVAEMGTLRFYYDEIHNVEELLASEQTDVVINDNMLGDITKEIRRIRSDITS